MSTPQDPQYPQYPQGGSSGGQPGQPSSGGSSAAQPPDQGGYTPPGQYPAPGQYPSGQSGGGYPETGGQAYTPPGQYPQSGGYGQYPQGGSAPEQYGQYPGGGMPPAPGGYGGGGYSGGTAPATRPREVDLSYYLWLAYIGLGVLSLLLVFTDLDQIRADAREAARDGNVTVNGQPADQATIDTAATIAVVIAVLVGLFFILIPLLFAVFMRRGRNWARIVLAVIAAIGILFGLLALGGGGFESAVSVVRLLLLIGATVFMFHPKSNPWFQKRPAY